MMGQQVSDLVRRGEVTLGSRYFANARPEIAAEARMLVACSPEQPPGAPARDQGRGEDRTAG
jgi:hypothetical protein